jgi:hypothetical protein
VVVVATLALPACATTQPAPTQLMARTAMELHVAEQQGARHSAEGAVLCQRAEQALEHSRRRAFRGDNVAARAAAERGYEYARQARELGELESRARIAELRRAQQQGHTPVLGITSLTAAELTAGPVP